MGSNSRVPTPRLIGLNLLKYSKYSYWRGDRVVDGNGLENRRGETHRGFESLPLRQVVQ